MSQDRTQLCPKCGNNFSIYAAECPDCGIPCSHDSGSGPCGAKSERWDHDNRPYCEEHFPRPALDLYPPWYVDGEYATQGTWREAERLWYVCDSRTNVVAFVPWDDGPAQDVHPERTKAYAKHMAQRICDAMNGRPR